MNNVNISLLNTEPALIVADPEHASAASKKRSTRFTLRALAVAMILSFGDSAHAMPAGGTVTSGSATITSVGGKMTITETTPKVTINWQSFSIGSGEAVQYIQPGAGSVALNRVLGSDISNILGGLSANGRLFLVNPNGIVFGSTARVSVGGLVASTLNITDSDFRAGTYKFSGAGGGPVLNQGTIATTADGGYVALLGANVSNEGVIAARMGTVALAAGTAVTLDVAGDGLLNVTVDQGAVNALVKNGGLIQADGGQVLLTAQTAGNLLQSAVNNTGIIQARSIENHNGVIRLLGGDVVVSGTLDASGSGAGQTGGTVNVTGKTVKLAAATINTSGRAGGGRVAVGGNFHGAGPLANAQSTTLDGATLINADAITSGNGGQIAVWSDGTTSVAGTLSARGGATSGDGGYIETSGKPHTIADATLVNTSAAYGTAGTWLLDPTNFTIGTDILGATLSGNLVANNITIHSGDGATGVDGDIFVNQAVSWATATTLTLDAVRDVIMNAAVTPSSGGSFVTNAGRDVTMLSGSTVTATGGDFTVTAVRDVNFNAGSTVTTTDGSFSSTSGGDTNIDGAVTTTRGNFTANSGHNITISSLMTMTGITPYASHTTVGNVTLRAGDNGVPGGTVIFTGVAHEYTVTDGNVNIYYTPPSYTAPGALTDYTGNFNPGIPLSAHFWAFVKGNDKTYDGTTAATVSYEGPPSVTFHPGSASFDTKDVGTNKVVTLVGYSITGDANFVLFDLPGATTGAITQAPLSITASDAAKVYGQSIVLTAYTEVGLVNNESIGSVTLSSPGTASDASAAGSPYFITPSSASGGSFLASNYTITYLQGKLVVAGSTTPGEGGSSPSSGSVTPGTTSPGTTSPGTPSRDGSSDTITPITPGAGAGAGAGARRGRGERGFLPSLSRVAHPDGAADAGRGGIGAACALRVPAGGRAHIGGRLALGP